MIPAFNPHSGFRQAPQHLSATKAGRLEHRAADPLRLPKLPKAARLHMSPVSFNGRFHAAPPVVDHQPKRRPASPYPGMAAARKNNT